MYHLNELIGIMTSLFYSFIKIIVRIVSLPKKIQFTITLFPVIGFASLEKRDLELVNALLRTCNM